MNALVMEDCVIEDVFSSNENPRLCFCGTGNCHHEGIGTFAGSLWAIQSHWTPLIWIYFFSLRKRLDNQPLAWTFS